MSALALLGALVVFVLEVFGVHLAGRSDSQMIALGLGLLVVALLVPGLSAGVGYLRRAPSA